MGGGEEAGVQPDETDDGRARQRKGFQDRITGKVLLFFVLYVCDKITEL